MTPNSKGVQQSIKGQNLLIHINTLKSSSPDEFQKMTSLKIKLTGDGTFIGKYIHVVNIAFTLLNEGNLAISVEGNHTIAIIRVKEDYDELKAELADIINEVDNLQAIDFDNNHYDIERYLGGDWKFLAMVCGIRSAIGEYPCIWCKCPTGDKFDVHKEWLIIDISK